MGRQVCTKRSRERQGCPTGSRGTSGVSSPGGVRGCQGGNQVSKGVKNSVRGFPGVEGSLGDPRGLKGVSEVYKGLKESPGIYKKRVAFCKIYFPYFARDKWLDHDFENCSGIRRVTRIRKMLVQSQI